MREWEWHKGIPDLFVIGSLLELVYYKGGGRAIDGDTWMQRDLKLNMTLVVGVGMNRRALGSW